LFLPARKYKIERVTTLKRIKKEEDNQKIEVEEDVNKGREEE
jgi:hypothetical protein